MTGSGRGATAEYIAKMCEELAVLADRNRFGIGSYLLRMASTEFQNQCTELTQRVESKESVG